MFFKTNVTVFNPPKGIENQNIKLTVPNNLDKAISQMKRDAVLEYDKKKTLQLKCCLLFLCGMSFSDISKQLGLSKSTISKYLNDDQLEGLLSFEYQKLFQMNQNRLGIESLTSKIQEAVSAFIEQEGDIKRTMQITGYSKRSLSRYFNHPELKMILNSVQYELFLEIKHKKLKENKTNAGYSRAYQDSIQTAVLRLNPNGIVQKRYCRLCKAILVDHIYDIKRLIKIANMSEENILKYLTDFSRCEMFLPIHVLEALKEKAQGIIKTSLSQQMTHMDVIRFCMSNRYSLDEIAYLLYFSNGNIIECILTKNAKILLSEEEYNQLRTHLKEVKLLLHSCPKNAYFIKDQKMIELVKPDIFYVKPEEYSVLSLLVDFLTLYDSIQFQKLSESLETAFMNLYSHLSCLKRLLTDEAYQKVKTCLEIEKLLNGNELQKKYEYIMQVIKTFFMNDFDLEETAKKEGIEVTSLIRILQNPFIKVNYGDIVFEYIEAAILNYQTFCQREKIYLR